jgi:hypothetical protein
MLRIANDLEGHDWYVELVTETIAAVEAYLGRWADFEAAVSASEPHGGPDELA